MGSLIDNAMKAPRDLFRTNPSEPQIYRPDSPKVYRKTIIDSKPASINYLEETALRKEMTGINETFKLNSVINSEAYMTTINNQPATIQYHDEQVYRNDTYNRHDTHVGTDIFYSSYEAEYQSQSNLSNIFYGGALIVVLLFIVCGGLFLKHKQQERENKSFEEKMRKKFNMN